MELRIDPEFQNKIPPLTDDEFKQLEENILTAGEVYEPIVTWNGIIVDGHNRWKIIQAHPEISWRIRSMEFADKWAAFDWMYRNQLGRRNLTEQQRTDLIGLLAIARMNTHGGDRGNQYTNLASGQNGTLPNDRKRTRDVIAEELGIGARTVDRAIGFAKGISAIREQEPEIADSILKGELSVKKADVIEIGKGKDDPTLREKIEKLKKGEPIREKKEVKTKEEDEKPMGKPMIRTSEPIVAVTPQIKPEKEIPIAENPRAYMAGTKENKELNRLMRTSIAELENKIPAPVYTVDMMLGELTATIDMYSRTIETFYQTHRNMYTKANQAAIEKVYNECLIGRMMKMKEEIEYV